MLVDMEMKDKISFWVKEKIKIKTRKAIFASRFVNHLNDDPFQRSGYVRLDHILQAGMV